MPMQILAVIAGLAFLTVFAVLGAMWWRLRRHLRHSDQALQQALEEIQPEQEQVDKS
jgi:uncharacterized membrane protein YqjE